MGKVTLEEQVFLAVNLTGMLLQFPLTWKTKVAWPQRDETEHRFNFVKPIHILNFMTKLKKKTKKTITAKQTNKKPTQPKGESMSCFGLASRLRGLASCMCSATRIF